MLFKSSDRKAALCSHELFLEKNICFVESLRAAVAEDITTEAWSLIFLPRISSHMFNRVRQKVAFSAPWRSNFQKESKREVFFLRGLSSPAFCTGLNFGIYFIVRQAFVILTPPTPALWISYDIAVIQRKCFPKETHIHHSPNVCISKVSFLLCEKMFNI